MVTLFEHFSNVLYNATTRVFKRLECFERSNFSILNSKSFMSILFFEIRRTFHLYSENNFKKLDCNFIFIFLMVCYTYYSMVYNLYDIKYILRGSNKRNVYYYYLFVLIMDPA